MKQIESKNYGLKASVVLRELPQGEIAIVKKIKSRIIRKDALKISEMADQIRLHQPNATVVLICTRNICSKSLVHLEDSNIAVVYEDL